MCKKEYVFIVCFSFLLCFILIIPVIIGLVLPNVSNFQTNKTESITTTQNIEIPIESRIFQSTNTINNTTIDN